MSKTFGERYGRFLGAIKDLPSDLAAQHEHYRLGKDKRYDKGNQGLDTNSDWAEKAPQTLQDVRGGLLAVRRPKG
jgi:hypothetical protein